MARPSDAASSAPETQYVVPVIRRRPAPARPPRPRAAAAEDGGGHRRRRPGSRRCARPQVAKTLHTCRLSWQLPPGSASRSPGTGPCAGRSRPSGRRMPPRARLRARRRLSGAPTTISSASYSMAASTTVRPALARAADDADVLDAVVAGQRAGHRLHRAPPRARAPACGVSSGSLTGMYDRAHADHTAPRSRPRAGSDAATSPRPSRRAARAARRWSSTAMSVSVRRAEAAPGRRAHERKARPHADATYIGQPGHHPAEADDPGAGVRPEGDHPCGEREHRAEHGGTGISRPRIPRCRAS